MKCIEKSLVVILALLFVAVSFSSPVYAEKVRVAVSKFTAKDAPGTDYWRKSELNMGTGMADMLESALTETGRFSVMSRIDVQDIISEQDLGASGRVSKKTKAKIGKIKGAQIILNGVITVFEYSQKGMGGGVSFGGYSIGGDTKTAIVAGIIKIVNAETSEMQTLRFRGEAKRRGLSLGAAIPLPGAKSLGVSFGGFKKTPMGEATQKAIDDIVVKVQAHCQNLLDAGTVMVSCPKCGTKAKEGTKFCPSCGAEIPQAALEECPYCNAEVSPGAVFCPECGKKIQGITCSKCSASLKPGTKFCPKCGTKVQ
ncbi:MAG: CsgG/HfaB family protein [bacterium]